MVDLVAGREERAQRYACDGDTLVLLQRDDSIVIVENLAEAISQLGMTANRSLHRLLNPVQTADVIDMAVRD